MRQSVVAAVLVAGGIIGGLVGGLLSAYWWDFGPEEDEYYAWGVAFYAALGAIIGLIVSGLLLAVADAVYFERRRQLPR